MEELEHQINHNINDFSKLNNLNSIYELTRFIDNCKNDMIKISGIPKSVFENTNNK